jgi:hypothetical protein
MPFRQITHLGRGCAAYPIGDGAAGLAAVVDPRSGGGVADGLERA